MRFLVDAQLPPALARWLSGRGHEASHVSDVGLQAASDAVIWNYAYSAQMIIVTKDQDFAQRKVLVLEGPRIIWIRLRNTRRQQLVAWFEHILPEITVALARGDTLIEVSGLAVTR